MNSSPLYSLHHGRFHERKSSFNLNRKSKQLREGWNVSTSLYVISTFSQEAKSSALHKAINQRFWVVFIGRMLLYIQLPQLRQAHQLWLHISNDLSRWLRAVPIAIPANSPLSTTFPEKTEVNFIYFFVVLLSIVCVWYCLCDVSISFTQKNRSCILQKNDVATLLSSSYLPFHSLIDSSET